MASKRPILKTVLHIEDDPEQRAILARFLRGRYRYVGRECAEDAQAFLSEKRVDFILLDLALPVMNGFEFLKQTAGILGPRRIPVVITTGVAGRNIQAIGKEYRCHAFLAKPYQPLRVLDLLDRYFAAHPAGS
jgi:CheY-like chemotaxis protein